ncbi:LysR family transcriptional regulator [Acidimangrovimonas sediminis]|uniref:LysR family transcriptional regulator n=1 Tax=Acidimangrovimonas sediminis TaxID=2056283 RepID=UPI000C809230|nr:LysR substrate-binding domain-containing protein [Acidimangrovimonas sediminis]
MNLTVRQLETFREVMRCRSISEAARNLGRTQPAVSSMIMGLEAELGFRLFERTPGRFEETPEAIFFAEETEAILARIDRTRNSLRNLAAHEHGRIRIACHPAAAGIFLPGVLAQFLADKPEVEASLMMRSSTVIEDLIASQQFDVGFAETPAPRRSVRQEDFEFDYLCAVPRSDPLAECSAITPEHLDDRPMATLFAEHPSFRRTQEAFAMRGCRIRRRFELRTFQPGLRLVAARQCYMICDMVTAYSYLQSPVTGPDVVFRRFAPGISSGLSILTPALRPVSLVAQAFCKDLSREVQGLWQAIQPHLLVS